MLSWFRGFRGLALFTVAFAAAACTNPKPPDEKDFAAKVAAERAAKDAAFAASHDPIPAAAHARFLPLAYFPVDLEYNAPAQFKSIADPTTFEMPTSTGTNRKMRRVGMLEFVLKGQPLKLTAFNEVGDSPSHLFVPFSDLTSGAETYPAGRFLDLNRNATSFYEIDFNRAYIPYCYYNPTYECPLPPPENRLKIPIRAGERMKKSEVGSLK